MSWRLEVAKLRSAVLACLQQMRSAQLPVGRRGKQSCQWSTEESTWRLGKVRSSAIQTARKPFCHPSKTRFWKKAVSWALPCVPTPDLSRGDRLADLDVIKGRNRSAIRNFDLLAIFLLQ